MYIILKSKASNKRFYLAFTLLNLYNTEMIFDWENTYINLSTFGKYTWKKGIKSDPTWTGYVTDNHVWLVYAGTGQINTHNGVVQLKKDLVFWFQPGFCYRATQDPNDPVGIYAVHFDLINSKGRLWDQNISPPPECTTTANVKYIQMLFEKMLMAGTGINSGGSIVSENHYRYQKCENLLKLILMEIDFVSPSEPSRQKENKKNEDFLSELAHQIQLNPAARPNIKELAEKLGTSSSNLCQSFKRRFGKSPIQYCIYWRMVHTRRLLEETALTTKEIASLLGYKIPDLLGKQFTQMIGLTPKQYRKFKKTNTKSKS